MAMTKAEIEFAIRNTPELKLNKRNLRAWLAALRSGKYRQGRGALRTVDNTYCCLGVAAKVCPKTLGQGVELGNDSSLREEYFPFNVADQLITLNDNQHRSFKYIANWLEKRLLPLVPGR